MALVLADRVRETTTTAGTGTITLLGAVPSCQSFAVVGNGNTTYYTIVAYTGTEYEVGIGTYTSSGTTLSRDTVLASSNGGSLVNFSIGTKDVFVDYPAGRAVYEDAAGNVDGYPITGGTINNTVIGGTTPAASTFTTVTTPIVGAASGSSTTGLDLNVNSKAQARVVEIGDGTRPLVINGGSAGGSQSPGLSAPVNLHLSSGTSARVIFYTNGRSATQQAEVSHTASAVNYHQLTGSATGSGPIHSVAGSDTNIDLNLTTKGTGNHVFNSGNGTQFRIVNANSSVNYFQTNGAATGGQPGFRVDGSDTNISTAFTTKGTGSHFFLTNGFSQTQLVVAHTASAVNYVQVTGAATGGRPTIIAQGSDTNINFVVASKGSGSVGLRTDSSTTQVSVIHTASAVNFLTATGSVAGSGPIFSVAGTDTNIDLNATSKGTGNINLGTGNGTQFRVESSGSAATDFVMVGGSNTGRPFIRSASASGNIDLAVSSQGTGAVRLYTNFVGQEQARVSHTASAVNYLQATGGATGSGVTLSAQGSDTNIDINLVPKGTGTTVYTGGVTVNGLLTAQTEVLKGSGQNFLLWSADFSNAVWGGVSSNVTRTTTTIDFTNASAYAYQLADPAVTGSTYTFSVTLSSTNKTAIAIRLVGSATSGGNQSLITLTATPTRYSVTATLPSGNTAFIAGFENRVAQGGDGSLGSITVSNAQLELGSTVNTYIATTTAKVYGTPTLSFSGVSTIGLESNGSLFVQPAGTGALQAQATTSSTVGGNARGVNAVDWQTARSAASQVASAQLSVIGGGTNNTVTGPIAGILSGGFNSVFAQYAVVAGGAANAAGQYASGILAGQSNQALGYFNLIGGGFTNSATSGSAVTTQSATMNATTAVTLSGSNANIKVGQYITGTSIASDTYVFAISGTSLTLSKVASGSSTSTLSFFTPHGVVVGGGNNTATGSYSFIGGGGDAGAVYQRNVASGDWSTVVGGIDNVASGIASFVGGGGTYTGGFINGNTSSGDFSVTGGGLQNFSSGFGSAVLGGFLNSASTTYTVVAGGQQNSASNLYAFVGGGVANAANGYASTIAGGFYGITRGITGYYAFPACVQPIANAAGVSQGGLLILGRQTTDATATRLTSDANSAGIVNQVIMPNNSAYAFRGTVIANVTGAANGASWSFEGAIMRGANAASTVLMGTPAINRVAATAGATAWVIALTADTTNGGLAVTVTGAASTTIRWVCKAETTEVTF